MLMVTDAALGHLEKALSSSNQFQDAECFRMVVTDDDTIGLKIQTPEAGDQTFESNGTTVLALPKSLASVLAERALDLSDEGQLVFLPKPS